MIVVLAVLAVVAALLSRRDPKIRRVRIGLFVERDRFNGERNNQDDGDKEE